MVIFVLSFDWCFILVCFCFGLFIFGPPIDWCFILVCNDFGLVWLFLVHILYQCHCIPIGKVHLMTGVILCINVMASPMVWTFQTETFLILLSNINFYDILSPLQISNALHILYVLFLFKYFHKYLK